MVRIEKLVEGVDIVVRLVSRRNSLTSRRVLWEPKRSVVSQLLELEPMGAMLLLPLVASLASQYLFLHARRSRTKP